MTKKDRKEFLKKDEFAEAVKKSGSFFAQNKVFLMVLVGLVIAGFITKKVIDIRQKSYIKDFNTQLFEAEQSVKKQQDYNQILSQYKDIPASQIARLNLVDNFLSKENHAEALKTLDEGLNKHTKTDVFSTLLALKKVGILKSQKQYAEAVTFIKSSSTKIIDSFKPYYTLLQADLLALAGNNAEAKQIYQQLITTKPLESEKENNAILNQVIQQAKQKVLLLNLSDSEG